MEGGGCREAGQHLGTEYLVGGIALTVFHSTTIAAGEEKHLFVTQQLHQIMVEIACFVGVL